MIAGMHESWLFTKSLQPESSCNAGTLGILMPPSIVMVVYCAVTVDMSVGRIFLAGMIPALIASIYH